MNNDLQKFDAKRSNHMVYFHFWSKIYSINLNEFAPVEVFAVLEYGIQPSMLRQACFGMLNAND